MNNTVVSDNAEHANEGKKCPLCGKKCPLPRPARIALRVVIAIVVVFLILQYSLGLIIKGAVSGLGPLLIGSDIKIEKIHTRIFAGKVNIKGVVVGPPKSEYNFEANVFELSEFNLSMDLMSVFGGASKPILIHQIHINAPIVAYELKGIHSNLSALMANIGANEKSDEKKTQGRKVIIEHFLFENGKVKIAVLNGKGANVPLPKIELHDIGAKNGGATAIEATAAVFGSIVKGVVTVAVDVVSNVSGPAIDGAKAIGGAAVSGVKAVGGAIGSLFSSSSETSK